MYAELMGNHKNQRIKSLQDNKIDNEHGTGIYADEHRGGARTKWLGKLPDGRIRWIKGQRPKHFMLRTYEEYKEQVPKYFKIKGQEGCKCQNLEKKLAEN